MNGQRFEELFGEDLNMLRCLLLKHDPERKFRNNFMDKYLFSNKDGMLSEKQEIELYKKQCPYMAKM